MGFVIAEVQIKRLDKQDVATFQEVIKLFHQVFETENDIDAQESYLQKLLSRPDFVVYAAIYQNEIVGGLTGYVLPLYYAEYCEFFIYDIAIKAKLQRQGVGKKLISTLKDYCWENKIREILVQAHEEDAHAVNFYQSIGGKTEKVIQFIL